MLPPPPRHCPLGTITVRPPSAALGRLVYKRAVRDQAQGVSSNSGARCGRDYCLWWVPPRVRGHEGLRLQKRDERQRRTQPCLL